MGIGYRGATFADAEGIAALHAASWRANYRGALTEEYLAGPIVEERLGVWRKRLSEAPANQYVVIAEEDGQMVGFACAFGERDERWGVLLDNLHVLREWQGTGTGRGLVARVAKWVIETYPESGLYLWVLEQNTKAQGFYARLKGVHEGSQMSEMPGGGMVKSHRIVWAKEALGELAGG